MVNTSQRGSIEALNALLRLYDPGRVLGRYSAVQGIHIMALFLALVGLYDVCDRLSICAADTVQLYVNAAIAVYTTATKMN